jgi:hypothetical protein
VTIDLAPQGRCPHYRDDGVADCDIRKDARLPQDPLRFEQIHRIEVISDVEEDFIVQHIGACDNMKCIHPTGTKEPVPTCRIPHIALQNAY